MKIRTDHPQAVFGLRVVFGRKRFPMTGRGEKWYTENRQHRGAASIALPGA